MGLHPLGGLFVPPPLFFPLEARFVCLINYELGGQILHPVSPSIQQIVSFIIGDHLALTRLPVDILVEGLEHVHLEGHGLGAGVEVSSIFKGVLDSFKYDRFQWNLKLNLIVIKEPHKKHDQEPLLQSGTSTST